MKKFEWIDKTQGSIKDDIFSGLTVALALVPEAIAFAFIAGISPIIGLYGAFMMALITALLMGDISGTIKLFQSNIIDFTFWIGIITIFALAIIFLLLAKLMHKKINNLKDL